MKAIKEVSFKVTQDAVLVNPENGTRTAVTGHKVHSWALGLGPCGREVAELSYEITLAGLTIRQVSFPKGYLEVYDRAMQAMRHSRLTNPQEGDSEALKKYWGLNGQSKAERFTYKLEDIVGRIRALE